MNTCTFHSSLLLAILRWTARVLGGGLALLLLALMVGEGFNPFRIALPQAVQSVFMPVGVLVGLCLAWRWARFGGALTLGSLAVFYLLELLYSGRLPKGWVLPTFALSALLFLLVGFWQQHRPAKPVGNGGH